MKKMDSPEKN